MAKLDKFNAKAPIEVLHTPAGHAGAEQSLAQISSTFGQLARKFRARADVAFQKEGHEQGLATVNSVDMPTPSYSFSNEGSVIDKIIGVESSGNPNAKNPNSSAAGLGQFVSGTWMDMIKRYRPDLMAGRSSAEILNMRYDPELNRQMLVHFTNENRNYLKEMGVAQTHGNLYLAHFLGRGDASKMLAAAPNTPVEQLLSPGVINANASILRGKTVGQVMNWAGKKMGGEQLSVTPGAPLPKLDLKGDATIKGRAFDDAARSAYINKADISLRSNLDALSTKYADNPAAMQKGLNEYLDGALSEIGDEQVRAALETTGQRLIASHTAQAARQYERVLSQEAAASFENGLFARENSLYQSARALPIDENGDAVLGQELSSAEIFIDNSNLSPEQKGRKKRALREGVAVERLLGAFDSQATLGEKQAFVADINEAWENGDKALASIGIDAFDRLNSSLAQQINKEQAEVNRQTKAIEGNISSVMNQLETGVAVSAEVVTQLTNQAEMIDNPALLSQVGQLQKYVTWYEGSRQLRPSQLDAQIANIDTEMVKNGVSENLLQAREVVAGLKSRAEKALQTDPLAWSDATGVIELTPLDFSSKETMQASLTARFLEAQTAGEHYGQDVPLFRPHEVAQLAVRSNKDAQFMGQFAVSMSQIFGKDTPKVLAQLSDQAPLLAHTAGLAQVTGSLAIFDEMSAFDEIRNADGYQPDLPKGKEFNQITQAYLGGAFIALPKTKMAATELATKLYEGRAYSRGIGADDFEQRDGVGHELFIKSLNDALGAQNHNGVQFGGIANINGAPTLLPTQFDAESVQDALDQFSDQDFASQMPVVTANGIPIRPDQMSNAKLVATGQGRYRVALNDPLSANPKYLQTDNGSYFELDIAKLIEAQQHRHSLLDERRITETLSTPDALRPEPQNALSNMFEPAIPVDE
jgi:hypothetical protein